MKQSLVEHLVLYIGESLKGHWMHLMKSAAVLIAVQLASGCTPETPGYHRTIALPDFQTKDLDGVQIDSAAILDQSDVTVFHFWGTWCVPCMEELPELARASQVSDPQKLQIIAIAVTDVPSEVRRVVQQTGLRARVVLDQDKALTTLFRIKGFPTTLGFRRDGHYLGSSIGVEETPAALLERFARLAKVN